MVVANQPVRAEVGENAVLRDEHRGGGGVAGFVDLFKLDLWRWALPGDFAVGFVNRKRDQSALGQAGEENALARQYRRRQAGWQGRFPSKSGGVEFDRRFAVLRHAGAVRSPELVPTIRMGLAKRACKGDPENDGCRFHAAKCKREHGAIQRRGILGSRVRA